MQSRIASMVLAMLLVLGQLALPVAAAGHDVGPAHGDDDCAVCAVIQPYDDHPDGLSPADGAITIKSERGSCLLVVAAFQADLTPSSYNPRGPPPDLS